MKGRGSVLMHIEILEKREQEQELRVKVMDAEEERLSGAKTRSISQARVAIMSGLLKESL